MPDLIIEALNEAYIQLQCEEGIGRELYEHFSFYVPNFQYTPLFKKKLWDGKIHLFDRRHSTMYRGLLPHVITFAKDHDYTVHLADALTLTEEFSLFEAGGFVESLKIPLTPKDFQIESFVSAIRNKRELLVSPTASGKSLILYLIVRYLEKLGYTKGIIIVPTTGLVEQLYGDFKDYGWQNIDRFVHRIYEGKEKQTPHFLTISTWQSAALQPPEYLHAFDFILGDEAHTFKAKSLTTLMTNLINAKTRIGCTGTLDGTKTNKLVLEGLFGPTKQFITTKELMDRKDLAELTIKALVLKYPVATCKAVKDSKTYEEEIKFLIANQQRNNFIKNLALSLKHNTLVLYNYVDKHGKGLFEMIQEAAPNKQVFFVHGKVPAEERERIRQLVEYADNAIVVASYGTFSTGINIKNLHNFIAASPSKSKIRVLQSIGRVLRTNVGKSSATLFDIVDDLRIKKYENHVLRQFMERLVIYDSQKFNYKLYHIEFKEILQ